MSTGNIVVYGAGSIGSAIGGWIAPRYHDVYLIARGKHSEAMRKRGLTLQQASGSGSETVAVNLIDSLKEASGIEIVILTVKNFDLIEASKDIFSRLHDEATIVALQNGVENQRVLPKYFSKVIYGVVAFSAIVAEPGVIKYQSRGPVYLGVTENKTTSLLEEIHRTFNSAFDAEITYRLQDTVHCKIVLNLTNALFTLVGFNYRDLRSYSRLATIASKLLNEGIDIIQTAGYKEYPMKNYPSWKTLRASLKLPAFFRTTTLRRSVKHAIVNSMGQDVLLKRKAETELDTLNGYVISLADSIKMEARYNRALYDLCKQEFSKADFEPLTVEKVWDELGL